MNFKMQNKQNQLIERITDQHLVILCGYCRRHGQSSPC
ncbi:hypothetical protein OKW24_001198 [Peribacillus simplex]|nr:hypothetical protein [Peribacillus simplex]